MVEKRFENYDYNTIQKIEEYCNELPILSHNQAMAFFTHAGNLIKKDLNFVERQSGRVFESLSGFVSSSDRQDFTVTYDFPNKNLLHGLLMLETFDDVLGILFCVARVSESLFLTYGFTQSQKEAIISLRNSTPGDTSD